MSVILLFGLILSITLLIIYDRIEVKSTFENETLTIGSFVVSNLETDDHYLSFSVINPKDFIEKHITNHDDYQYMLADDQQRIEYYIFVKGNALFTLTYNNQTEGFELYSGSMKLSYNEKTYVIPAIDLNQTAFNLYLFESYDILKDYYAHLSYVIIDDDNKAVRLTAYLIDLENHLMDEQTTIDVLLTYHEDGVIISFL